jgi:short-subunit dehydrogenase
VAAVLPGMLQRRRGHVVAISSLAALQGLPRQMGYCASKAGLNALMECLRLDVKDHGIMVTTICPGWTRTPLTEGKYAERELMSVDETTEEILYAVAKRKAFHAFPWYLVWELRLISLLPTRLRDWLLLHRMGKLDKVYKSHRSFD